jgi:predicted alpha/beta hydrolase
MSKSAERVRWRFIFGASVGFGYFAEVVSFTPLNSMVVVGSSGMTRSFKWRFTVRAASLGFVVQRFSKKCLGSGQSHSLQ